MSFTGQIWSEIYHRAINRPSIHPGYYTASRSSPGPTSACAVGPAASRGRSLTLRPRPVGWTSRSSQRRTQTPLGEGKKEMSCPARLAAIQSHCEAQAPEHRGGGGGGSKMCWSTCGESVKGKRDGMRLERRAAVSLVFRRDAVGVMLMTLVRGDINFNTIDADGSVKHDWFGGCGWMMTEWNYSKLHAL